MRSEGRDPGRAARGRADAPQQQRHHDLTADGLTHIAAGAALALLVGREDFRAVMFAADMAFSS